MLAKAFGSCLGWMVGGLALILSGCQSQFESSAVDSTTSATKDESAIPGKAKVSALAAKEALFAKLSSRLSQVMQTEGPAAAIRVCSQEASGLAKEVSSEQGVTIGRTAVKLRNPKNAPPEWAAKLISQNPAKAEYVLIDEGKTGALLPIKLQVQCLTCHGPKESPRQ